MLSSYLSMQNAIMMQNTATLGMMHASDNMLRSVSFGNSQPLRPSFSADIANELSMKANETKVSVMQKLIEAYEKKLAQDIKNSAPKYAGLDYKA